MKILLYNDQTIALDSCQKSIMAIFYHFYLWLSESLLKHQDVEIKTIVPEITYEQYLKYNKMENLPVSPDKFKNMSDLNFIPLTDKELKKTFDPNSSFHDIYEKIFADDLDSKQRDYFSKLLKDKLGDWVPDIIIEFPVYAKFLSSVYPSALNLLEENAIFSRYPFMRTMYYDPCGAFGYNFLNKFKDEIKNFKITEAQVKQVQDLKDNVVKIIDENNPFAELLKEYKNKYKKLVLLPLCGTIPIGDEYNFKNDYNLLSYVLENVPEDIGVFVTQHGDGGFLNDRYLEYFRNKYKNFIYIKELHVHQYHSASVNLFNCVDAIINPISATGIMGLLWDKKIISVSNYFNDWMKDAQGVENIKEILNQPNENKNNIIYWYLTHYAVFEKRYSENDWLYNYFSKRIDKFQKEGITFDYYEQNEDIAELSEYIINHLETVYNPPTPIAYSANFLQKIFSVKNEGTKKVLRLLGIKISFNRAK